jgi:hypothetical protein
MLDGFEFVDSHMVALKSCHYLVQASQYLVINCVLHLLNDHEIKHKMNLKKVVKAIYFLYNHLKKPPRSKTNLTLYQNHTNSIQDLTNSIQDLNANLAMFFF